MAKNNSGSSGSSGSCKRPANCWSLHNICIILMLLVVGGDWQRATAVKHPEKRGVADSFADGIKYAGQMFGINTAADVANLVAKAFSTAATTTTASAATSSMLPDLLSMFFQQRPQYPSASEESAEAGGQQEPQQQGTRQHSAQQQQQQQATDDHEDQYGEQQPGKESANVDFNSSKLIGGILRMIGFDARKLGALAINALVMIAQAIGSTLLGTFMKTDQLSVIEGGRLFKPGSPYGTADPDIEPERDADNPENEHQPRALRSGSPLDWYLENPTKEMKRYLKQATDAKLVDGLTNMIENAEKHSTAGEHSAACLKMLVCKSSPFIWGMQSSLKKQIKARETGNIEPETKEPPDDDGSAIDPSALFRYLPSLNEYREHGNICQKRFGAHCKYDSINEQE